jgi:hypothetical protein
MNDELRDSSTGRRSPQGQGEPGLPLGGRRLRFDGTGDRGKRKPVNDILESAPPIPYPTWGTLGGALCGSAGTGGRDVRPKPV